LLTIKENKEKKIEGDKQVAKMMGHQTRNIIYARE
jgi:hypothetical protein